MLRIRSRLVLVLAVLAPLLAGAAGRAGTAGGVLAGRLQVIDGDTVTVAGTTVRLHGIDAPELAQTCTAADGSDWACGRWAREALRNAFGGRAATCTVLDIDRYGRSVARCAVAGQDIGAALVRAGVAEAYRRYSHDYVDAEKEAFFAGRGIWAGTVEPPEQFRARTAPPPQQQPRAGCAIKGNVSASGRIYHLPGQRDYAATRISEAKGERWFCTEAEARAAGWRPAAR